jgi:uncharacterized protein YycO
MAAVILQFVAGTGLGAELIQWYGHGRYSHVDVVWPDGRLIGARNDVISGIKAGVQARPASYVAGEPTLQVSIPLSDAQSDAFYSFILKQIGKPYDEIAIAAFFLNADWSQAESWFCSMLMVAALQAAGWLRTLSEPCNKIDPDDLLLVLSAFVDV